MHLQASMMHDLMLANAWEPTRTDERIPHVSSGRGAEARMHAPCATRHTQSRASGTCLCEAQGSRPPGLQHPLQNLLRLQRNGSPREPLPQATLGRARAPGPSGELAVALGGRARTVRAPWEQRGCLCCSCCPERSNPLQCISRPSADASGSLSRPLRGYLGSCIIMSGGGRAGGPMCA